MATRTEIVAPCGVKILYVCPSTMVGNVIREMRQWAPHRSVVALGNQPKTTRKFLLDTMVAHNEYVVVINYEAWRKDMSLLDDLIKVEFDTIVLDEAHNIKDQKSIGYRGVKKLITEGNIPFVFPMTGTPILNRPQELYSLLSLVDPQHFWSERHFLYDFCQQDIYTKKWGFKPGGLDRLATQIRPQFLRRTKEQAGIKLPPKTITIHEIEVDFDRYPKQADCRRQMNTYASIVLDPETGRGISAAAVIAMYTRLRQIETWPDGIKIYDPQTKEIVMQVEAGESQKLDEIIHFQNHDSNEWEGLLPEVVSDERVVVFSQFKEPLKELHRRSVEAGIKSVILDGDTPDHVRNDIARDFDNRYTPDRANAKYDVVYCNYKVGGIGLNFTAATQMIIVDEEWNPGKRDQAYDRIHRLGQDKPVTIHVLRDKLPNGGGIDTWLADINESKEQMVDGFNTATDMAATGLQMLRDGRL